jgi:prophage regulatory protein
MTDQMPIEDLISLRRQPDLFPKATCRPAMRVKKHATVRDKKGSPELPAGQNDPSVERSHRSGGRRFAQANVGRDLSTEEIGASLASLLSRQVLSLAVVAIDNVAHVCEPGRVVRLQHLPKPRFPEEVTEMLDHSERLLRLRDVKEKTGLGSSTIYRRMADGTFPIPRSLGPNTVRWLQSEIDAWIRSLPSSQGGTCNG